MGPLLSCVSASHCATDGPARAHRSPAPRWVGRGQPFQADSKRRWVAARLPRLGARGGQPDGRHARSLRPPRERHDGCPPGLGRPARPGVGPHIYGHPVGGARPAGRLWALRSRRPRLWAGHVTDGSTASASSAWPAPPLVAPGRVAHHMTFPAAKGAGASDGADATDVDQ